MVRPGAKREVGIAVLLAALPWVNAFVGLLVRWVPPWALVLAIPLGLAVVLRYPLEGAAEAIRGRLVDGRDDASPRLRSVADGLAIAVGTTAEHVEVIASPVPNVIVLPTRSRGVVVIATEGALRLVPRRELEALVASQLGVAADPWVRVATRAQRAQAMWPFAAWGAVPLSIMHPVPFVVAMAITFAYLFASLQRRADFVRDLVADGVAIHTTKDPEALVRALRALRPAAIVAPQQQLGVWGIRGDAFMVLSTRKRASTSVTVNGRSRSWATEDELATELGLRAERMEQALLGNLDAMASLGPFRRAWATLGTKDNPYALTAVERAAATAAAPPS